VWHRTRAANTTDPAPVAAGLASTSPLQSRMRQLLNIRTGSLLESPVVISTKKSTALDGEVSILKKSVIHLFKRWKSAKDN